jgi:hypothetical protein
MLIFSFDDGVKKESKWECIKSKLVNTNKLVGYITTNFQKNVGVKYNEKLHKDTDNFLVTV